MRWTVLLGLFLLAGASRIAGQSVGLAPESGRPCWLEAWSPLAARADLPRRLPHVDAVPGALLLPAPRVGLFWTAGNPAALRSELSDTRTDFSFGVAHESGSFKRPFDPGARSLQHAGGSGWIPPDRRLALLGRAAVDQERFDPGTFSDTQESYPTSPFVTLDTSGLAMRRASARLEGATSLQLGKWAAGLALGYDSREQRTIESGFVRLLRSAIPGAVVGLSRSAGSGAVGAYGRWRQRAETIRLIERAAEGLAIQLEGLRDVVPFAIQSAYFRRTEETAWSAGLAAAGRLGQARWAVFGERDLLREGLTQQEQDNPAEDRWRADGWSAGGAYQRPSDRWLFTTEIRYAKVHGTGDLALDSAGVIFEANEQALAGRIELRREVSEAGWGAILAVQARYERRVRNALSVPIVARVSGLTTGLSAELARSVSSRTLLLGTLALASYSANSSFPAPNTLGSIYRTYILGEYDLSARKAIPWLGAVGARWKASAKTLVWALLSSERVAPTDKFGPTGLGPNGSRSVVSVIAGVTLK